MSFDLTLFTSTFVTLLVILDPPGAIPIFLALTGPLTPQQKVAAARRASLVALGVIASFALFGQRILDYLHISLPALQGAGGLLLLIVALQLLTGSESEQLADAGVNVALVPLGTPLLAGPGAIVATMLAVQGAEGAGGYLAVAVSYLEEGEAQDPEFLRQLRDRASSVSFRDGETKTVELRVVER